MTWGEIPKKQAERHPDNLALVYEGKGLTYKEFNERINRVANGLLSLGLKKGDIIAVLSDNSFPFYETQWACLKTGIVWQPINPLSIQPVEGVVFQINNTGAKVLFVKETIASPVVTFKGFEMIESIRPQLKEVKKYISVGPGPDYMANYEEWISKFSSEEPPGIKEVRPGDLAFLLASSGTTGFPKQAMWTSSNVWHGVASLAAVVEMTPGLKLYFPDTPYNTTTSWAGLVPIFSGGTIYMSNAQDPKTRLEELQKFKPFCFFVFPPMIPDIINFPEAEKYDPGTIRIFISSGGIPFYHYTKRMEEIFKGCKCLFGHCSVEQTTMTWARRYDHEQFMDPTKGVAHQGFATQCSWFKIVDEEGAELDAYEVGEIIATGAQRFQGYWNDPEKTKEVLDDKGWLHTGDVGFVDDYGCLYVWGRKEDLIITEGKKVPPAMVDSVIFLHPAVAETQTIGVPHKELGQAIKSIVVLKKGEKVTAEGIMEFCRERSPSYAVPKSIVFTDSLPKALKGIPKMAEIKERWGKEL
jgi:acyl-CoA synthetase (AMP-forming)/AMP-acid ligase II